MVGGPLKMRAAIFPPLSGNSSAKPAAKLAISQEIPQQTH